MGWVAAAAMVVSSVIGSKSASKAAKIQAESAMSAGQLQLRAAREVIAMQKEQFAQSREDLAPWREAGTRALAEQEDFKFPSYSLEDFEASPGYGFAKDEMQRAIGIRNAATGSFYSGRPMRELARYSAGLASQEFGNWFQRERLKSTDAYNRLAGLSDTGQIATSQTAQLGAESTTRSGSALLRGSESYGSALLAAGASRASGVLAKSKATTDAIGAIFGGYGGYGGFGGR